MNRRWLSVTLLAVVMMLIAAYLPAPIHPDCNNQPFLNCGLTCTSEGCVLLVRPDPSDTMFDFCYILDGGCLGGIHHPCCDN